MKKRNIYYMIFIVVILLIFGGCTKLAGTDENNANGNIDEDVNENADTDVDEDVSTEDSNTEKSDGNDWCEEGAVFKMSTSEGSVETTILGIVDTGKYEGYCHMRTESKDTEETAIIDYYYDKDGNGYQVMNIDGEKFEMSWKKGE